MSVENNGERVDGSGKDQNALCHIRRYEFVAHLLMESDIVLDFACGTGYGSEIMAERAQKVYGYDISPEAIEYAKQNHSKPTFSTELPDISPTVIVGLECLEHLDNPDEIIKKLEAMNPRLMVFSHPYMEEVGNTHHKHFKLHEHSFAFKKRPEIFYQSPSGLIGENIKNRQNIIYVV